jgi:hypothetical protein
MRDDWKADPWLRASTMRPSSELIKILFNCAIAAAIGYLLVTYFGRGLASPPSKDIDNFARFENIKLPVGARTSHGLKSFVVRLKGEVDDFGRVYVNNRQVTSTDKPESPFRYITWEPKDDDYKTRFAVNRANPTDAEVEVRRWLREGNNWMMVELENSRWGACTMAVEFLANGSQLEGSPYFIPQREKIDTSLSNPHLLKRFKELSDKTIKDKEFGIIPEYDAVCARLIFAFQLH